MVQVAGRDVVIVLSYFGCEDTVECVESLVVGNPDLQVVVIDNGSRDGVLDAVRARWESVAVLQTGENLGFSGGMNVGLRWALDRDARSVTVLNNDTVIPEGALSQTVSRCVEDMLLSPVIDYPDGGVWFGGGTIDRDTGLARHLSPSEVHNILGDAQGPTPVDVLTGCCVTALAGTWRKVGLFDDRFYLNFEDSELSVRARRMHVALAVDAGTHITHKVSRSFTGDMSLMQLFYYARNGLLFGRQLPGRRGQRAYRFLRQHVVPSVTRSWRDGERRESLGKAILVGSAIVSDSVGRYGRAPRAVETVARLTRRR